MHKKIVLICDLDGTLVNKDQPLDTELIDLLKRVESIAKLAIVSGRHPQSIKKVIGDALGFLPTISLNGASLHLQSWEKFDKVIYLPSYVVDRVEELIVDSEATLHYYGKYFWAASEMSPYVDRLSKITKMEPVEWNSSLASYCIKMVISCNSSIVNDIKYYIKSKLLYSIQINRSGEEYLEITAHQVNKATFIQDLFREDFSACGMPKTIFIGDSENDIPCARYADESWTFPSSPEALKTASTGILEFDNGKGVKQLVLDLFKRYAND